MAPGVPATADRHDIASVDPEVPLHDQLLALEHVGVVALERRRATEAVEQVPGLE
jgi:hypothetical protein